MNRIKSEWTSVEFLLTENIEAFYWIGFLLADGCFRASNLNGITSQISVLLAEVDKLHLDKLAVHLNSKITLRNNTGYTNFMKVSLTANSKIKVPLICEKFDIHQRKTYNPPNFNDYKSRFTNDQILSLIVGFIDGDGSLVSNGNNGYDLKIQLHYTWLDNLEFINIFIHEFFNVPIDVSAKITRRNIANLSIGKQPLIQFLKNFVVEQNLPVLSRKWDNIINSDPSISPPVKAYRKPIAIHGIEFKTMRAAAKYFNCSDRQFGRMVKHNDFSKLNME